MGWTMRIAERVVLAEVGRSKLDSSASESRFAMIVQY